MYLMLLTYIIALAVILSNLYIVFFVQSEVNWFCYLTCSSFIYLCYYFIEGFEACYEIITPALMIGAHFR